MVAGLHVHVTIQMHIVHVYFRAYSTCLLPSIQLSCQNVVCIATYLRSLNSEFQNCGLSLNDDGAFS